MCVSESSIEPPPSIPPTESNPMIEATGNDLVVVATNPQELVDGQNAIIASVATKIEKAKADLAEANEILAAAKMAAIDDTAAKRLVKKEEQHLLYLEKVHAALSAGYVMMPNIPGSIIGIRVQRQRPHRKSECVEYEYETRVKSEIPDALEVGEGRYVKPVPSTTLSVNRDDKGKFVDADLRVHGFDEQMALPMDFMKPTVIARTGEAFKMKIFDEILIVHDGVIGDDAGRQIRVQKGDPLVIGRIVLPGPGRERSQRRKVISFLIAWFVDTSAI